MEIVEHINDLDLFLEKSTKLVKEDGMIFISSISKNFISYFLSIVMAEKILKIVPEGTHDYEKYLNAEDIT